MQFADHQIGEYGSPEVKDNFATRTVIETGTQVNPHGIERKMEYYHRTAGFWFAGSCATYHANEIWGVTVYHDDGTTHGNMYTDKSKAESMWKFAQELSAQNKLNLGVK